MIICRLKEPAIEVISINDGQLNYIGQFICEWIHTNPAILYSLVNQESDYYNC